MNLTAWGVVVAIAVSVITLIRGFLRDGEDSAGTVADHARRIDALEKKAVEMTATIERVNESLRAIPLLDGKIMSLDRLVTYRLDEVSDQLRSIAHNIGAPITGRRGRRGGQDPDTEH